MNQNQIEMFQDEFRASVEDLDEDTICIEGNTLSESADVAKAFIMRGEIPFEHKDGAIFIETKRFEKYLNDVYDC